jgi:hypothetical protein
MWNGFKRWWIRLFSSTKQLEIRVSVSLDELELIEAWTVRQGRTVEDFVRESVLKAIPSSERRKFSVRHSIGQALEEGYKLLEDKDVLLSLPEANRSREAEVHSQLPSNHKCGFLDDKRFQPPYDFASSQGTCTHHSRKNLACFWPSQVADNCPHFRHAKIKSS